MQQSLYIYLFSTGNKKIYSAPKELIGRIELNCVMLVHLYSVSSCDIKNILNLLAMM